MPLIKKDLSFPALVRLIRGYAINGSRLAEILGCSVPTAIKKMEEPKRFTLEDIYSLSITGGIPLNEIKQALR